MQMALPIGYQEIRGEIIMNLMDCEALAQEKGFDSMEFIAMFPAGPINCKWLDAYMGLFIVNHDELKGKFLKTGDFPDIICVPLEGPSGCFE